VIGALTFLIGLGLGVIGGAPLLSFSYPAAWLYPPDHATTQIIPRQRGWLKEDI